MPDMSSNNEMLQPTQKWVSMLVSEKNFEGEFKGEFRYCKVEDKRIIISNRI